MSVEIDSTVFTAVIAGVGSVFAALSGAVVHLYFGRERDRAAYMAEMLSIAKTLREEEAAEKAELRARLDAAMNLPPPSQRSSSTRTRKR